MSDPRLRELERRWRESRAVEDEAAYLLERVRVGELSPERLELAAHCGHEAARRATGASADHGRHDLEEWLSALEAWGPAVCVRAHVILALLVLPWYEAEHPTDDSQSRALEAARAWLAEPSSERAGVARSASERAYQVRLEREPEGAAYVGAAVAAQVAFAASRALDGVDSPLTMLIASSADLSEANREAIRETGIPLLGDEVVSWEIRVGLILWALNVGDTLLGPPRS
ncbi:MAG: hypothetical protein KIT58_14300 [Planctomycetota bacterium]|nr:hypothetical protein [Planctomycetota bacterium]